MANTKNPKGPDSGSFRVVRGGSWYYNPQYLRSARRNRVTPGARYDGVGFRLVRTPNTLPSSPLALLCRCLVPATQSDEIAKTLRVIAEGMARLIEILEEKES